MKRLFTLLSLSLLLVMLLLTFVSCNKSPEGSDNTPDRGENSTVDRTQSTAGTYKIRFYLGNTPSCITHYYNAGETITPPDTLPSYTTKRENFYFNGWEGVEFQAVSGDATYRARVRSEYNYYNATFVVGTESIAVKTICGDYPSVPPMESFHLADAKFVKWDRGMKAFTEDVTITAITTKYFDPEYFLAAMKRPLLIYPSTVYANDNEQMTTENATALVCMLYEEHQHPQGGAVASRIVEHLTAVVTKEQAPAMDASCYWSYAILTGAIALAKQTPTVWDTVPADIKLRLDTMMRAFAYLGSFATSDYNSFETGPGMQGNYKKVWNPNFRLAMIPIIVYCANYFGNGDMDAGAATVNSYLKSFDEDAYNELINLFQKYGWRRASIAWTAEGRTATDGSGVVGASAKELLIYGGRAVGEDTSKTSSLLVPLGQGLGVTNGGNDYLYYGNPLTKSENIIRALVVCNYGTDKNYFIEVKSNHWYDKDGDGVKEIVAWIMNEQTSPYEGQYGMMREFASGDRSSAGYCSRDFVLATTMIYTCKLLGIYDLWSDTYLDPAGNGIREAVFVGNEDFLFKVETGYSSYATSNSSGGYVQEHYETKEDAGSYFAIKSLWRGIMMPSLQQTFQN